MTWVRIHDGALSHPKIIKLFNPRDPFHLWVWGLSYVQMHLTNGLIPKQALPNSSARTTARLLELHLWEPHDEGYIVHDYLDWNDSKEDVQAKRIKAKERMRGVRAGTNGERSREQLGERSRNVLESSSKWVGVSSESPALPVAISVESLGWFDRVYAAYPNKERKEKANREWILLAPTEAVVQKILRNIQVRIEGGWTRIERRFIPQLSTFLTDRMWEDAEEMPAFFEEHELPQAWSCGECGAVHEGTKAQAKAAICQRKIAK